MLNYTCPEDALVHTDAHTRTHTLTHASTHARAHTHSPTTTRAWTVTQSDCKGRTFQCCHKAPFDAHQQSREKLLLERAVPYASQYSLAPTLGNNAWESEKVRPRASSIRSYFQLARTRARKRCAGSKESPCFAKRMDIST